MSQPAFSHRPTLKQSNKSFKSKHATKSSLKNAAKGRVSGASPSSGPQRSKASLAAASAKQSRLNTLAQRRTQHRAAQQSDLKLFSTASSGGGHVPRIVAVVPLAADLVAEDWTRGVIPALGLRDGEADGVRASLGTEGARSLVLPAPRFKTALHVLHCPPLDLYAAMDAALASDYLVCLVSAQADVPPEGETILRALQGVAAGVEIVFAVVEPAANGEPSPLNPQTRPGILRSLLSFANYFFPKVGKVHVVPAASPAEEGTGSGSSDAANLARAVCEGVPAGAGGAGTGAGVAIAAGGGGRDARARLVVEEQDWRFVFAPARGGAQATAPGDAARFESSGMDNADEERGTLVVRGTVRGGRMSADRLVHLPGWGDFQVEKITAAPPIPTHGREHQPANAMAVDASAPSSDGVLSTPTDQADDLTATNVPDLMSNEQTWPTEEDMEGAGPSGGNGEEDEDDAERKVRMAKIAQLKRKRGAEGHQASWLIYASDEEDGEGGDDEEEAGLVGDDDAVLRAADGFGGDGIVDMEEDTETRKDDGHEDLDEEEEERQLASYRKQRALEDADDLHFPDEVDTPRHIPARTRFARYRGLKSFRTSPWDPYEDLPLDYARIFQFEDFERTRRRVEADGRGEGIAPGTRVEVHIKDVPRELVENHDGPLIVHGLLQHEHKQSVLHFAVQRNTEYTEPIRAKEPLILCVGPRRYRIRPLYSQHVRGGGKGVNNVHKSERYLRHGGAVVATTYGPVAFGKQSCLLLKEGENEDVPDLVAMGSFLSADPTRIIAKRIILTGHPFKVHRKTATVRYMFFNRDDISYFAPIELHTKYGRIGHIKEPLGTHGYFKAHFDGPIQQMDTVCMSLYKRQYPKFAEEMVLGGERLEEVEGDEDDGMDME